MSARTGIAGGIARAFIDSKLIPLVIALSLLLGVFALIITPREEEPQIVVPMIDILVQYPGADAQQVETKVSIPVEELMWQIPGVEYVYSTSAPSFSMVSVRFLVGEDMEDSLLKVMDKLQANYDRIPPGVSFPLVRPKSIDDVPQVALTLYSKELGHYDLRRVGVEVAEKLKRIENVSAVEVIGGQKRAFRVTPDPIRMQVRNISTLQVVGALTGRNWQLPAGEMQTANESVMIETGGFIQSREDLEQLVVGVYQNRPVFLKEVAEIIDGPEEATNHVFFGIGPGFELQGAETYDRYLYPAVTLSVIKRKGGNSVVIAEKVKHIVAQLKGVLIPDQVQVAYTRDYGETAKEKSDELMLHIWATTLVVALLIFLTLGVRETVVVFITVPVTLALTVFISYFLGYTLNRVSLFALVFAIGILVDDAIVVVENINRHYRLHGKRMPLKELAVRAVDEVGNPTVLATFAIVSALMPLAFVSGLMGPYMRPIPINASAAMLISLLVAFVISPWLAYMMLRYGKQQKDKDGKTEDHESPERYNGWFYRFYRWAMEAMVDSPLKRWAFLSLVALLLLGSVSLFVTRSAIVKMLPYDNKSEIQLIIDMPEGATLEQTGAAARDIGDYLRSLSEVRDYQLYVGTAAPINFNGLVRKYFMRQGENVADIQVNLVSKDLRDRRSHAIAKSMREPVQRIGIRHGANVKIVEVPPGPPVMSTLVAEVYGPHESRRLQIADEIRKVFVETDGVVDVDWMVQDEQKLIRFVPDPVKAAFHGISVEEIARTFTVAQHGMNVALADMPREKETVCIQVRLPRSQRASINDLGGVFIHAKSGRLVPLSELVTVETGVIDKWRYRKNLMPVTYVTGEVSGREESPVYAILKMKETLAELKLPEGYGLTQHFTSMPELDTTYQMKWDGEWHITYEVFRDMGIAFAAVMILIYMLVVGWFRSFLTPIIIMIPIPLTLVGIIPGHWLTGKFFTATSMIGFIALAGIIVRNSILLVDFTELKLVEGESIKRAVIESGVVRFLPILLTQATLLVGAMGLITDPIFEGMAITLIFGVIVSTILALFVIPLLYYIVNQNRVEAIVASKKGVSDDR